MRFPLQHVKVQLRIERFSRTVLSSLAVQQTGGTTLTGSVTDAASFEGFVFEPNLASWPWFLTGLERRWALLRFSLYGL